MNKWKIAQKKGVDGNDVIVLDDDFLLKEYTTKQEAYIALVMKIGQFVNEGLEAEKRGCKKMCLICDICEKEYNDEEKVVIENSKIAIFKVRRA